MGIHWELGVRLVQKIRHIRSAFPTCSAISALVALCRGGTSCGRLVTSDGTGHDSQALCQRNGCGSVDYVSRKAHREIAREGANGGDVALDQAIFLGRKPKADIRKRNCYAHNLEKAGPIGDVPRVEPAEISALLFLPDFGRHDRNKIG